MLGRELGRGSACPTEAAGQQPGSVSPRLPGVPRAYGTTTVATRPSTHHLHIVDLPAPAGGPPAPGRPAPTSRASRTSSTQYRSSTPGQGHRLSATPTPARSTSSTPPAASRTGATSSSSSLNSGETAEALVTALRDHIRGQVNSGVPDQFFQVLECRRRRPGRRPRPRARPRAGPSRGADARDGRRRDRGHPRRAAGHGAADRDARPTTWRGCWRRSRSRRAAWPKTSTCGRGACARTCRERSSGLVGELRAQARAAGEDQEYTDAVERAYAATRAWITGGLGIGEQAWRDEALRSMTRRPQQQPLRRRGAQPGPGGDQRQLRADRRLLHRPRSRSSGPTWRRCSATSLGHAARRPRYRRLRGRTRHRPRGRFDRLADLLDAAAEPPCPRLRRAVRDAARDPPGLPLPAAPAGALRARRARPGAARPDQTGQLRTQITVAATAAGAEELYRFVMQLAEQAVYETQKALLARVALPGAHAARRGRAVRGRAHAGGDSDREFRRLARSYRDEIWPGVFRGIDARTRASPQWSGPATRSSRRPGRERRKEDRSERRRELISASGWSARPGSARPL